ncbi:MAG: hypothetical protein MRJ96_04255 [Nitrospirales bacterium]|nr:hypothetical protein [Nitrospira sp.]MDR4500653.1 hypothetical protein [Nitrospirales bacterium]
MNIDATATLACAMILSAGCAVVGQLHSNRSSATYAEIFIISGLGLGGLLTPSPLNRYCLIGVLGYAAYAILQSRCAATRKTMSFGQIAFAIFLALVSSFSGDSLTMFAGLVLAVTFVPLPPFHLPFASLVASAQGTLSGLWTTVFLSLGLAELSEVSTFQFKGLPAAVSVLALGGALYGSLKSLGEAHIRPLLTYATIAHVSMLWGLTTVFPSFSEWEIAFGVTIALVMSGLFFMYDCVQERLGFHRIGILPGLAAPMPRLGIMLVILLSIAMLLPVIPFFTGLVTLSAADPQDVSLIVISFIILIVWMLGSWYFSRILHQTAFGKARPNIPYVDLKPAEICSLALLIAGASYSGLFY